jgi:hypothetical protein
MQRMSKPRVDAISQARKALRGMELAIRRAKYNRAPKRVDLGTARLRSSPGR